MKEKLISKLKELYPNLGLSEAIFENVGAVMVGTLAQDADDAAIEVAAKSCEAMLKAFQSDADKRVTDAMKKSKSNKDDDSSNKPGTDSEVLKMLKEMKDSQEAERKTLLDRIAALEGKNTEKVFDELVAKVAGELGLPQNVLDRAKRGLSSDMDEAKVKEELGSFKKFLAEVGATFEESTGFSTVTDDEAARESAKKYVEEHAIK